MKQDDDEQQPLNPANQKGIRKLSHTDRLGVEIYVLPNLITTLNMFFGWFSIMRSLNGDFTVAAFAIVAAAIFDLLDGRVARMTNTESAFGAQYDSLCDLISFGIAPSLLLFQWSLSPFGRIGWLVCFFFIACGALRLARFNVYTVMNEYGELDTDATSKTNFVGLPIPMAAGIAASAVLAFKDLGLNADKHLGILFLTALAGLAMVSNFPYRSFKDIDLKRRLPFRYLVFGVAVLAAIAIHPEITLFIMFVFYATMGLIMGAYNKFFLKRIV